MDIGSEIFRNEIYVDNIVDFPWAIYPIWKPTIGLLSSGLFYTDFLILSIVREVNK